MGESVYRLLVPEIFEPVPQAPAHSEVLVLGSGFGAAVTAYRLALAGVSVTVLERGSWWPLSRWRATFSPDPNPDGRGLWRRERFENYKSTMLGFAGTPYVLDYFGGVLDMVEYPNMDVLRGACVGGGSIVFAGVLLEPDQAFLNHMFRGRVPVEDLHNTYFPRARAMLNASPVPEDLYQSPPFHRHRVWNQALTRAGYALSRQDSIFNWPAVRDEMNLRRRPSAIIGESIHGNSNGAKYDLTQNYLKAAVATGKVRIHPRHEVTRLTQDSTGRYVLAVSQLAANGRVEQAPDGKPRTREISCDRLFLGAGSIGSTELLVRAQALGDLPNLNEHVGTRWGGNGDLAMIHGITPLSGTGITMASPIGGRATDTSTSDAPITLEDTYVPGEPLDVAPVMSLGMVWDETTGTLRHAGDGAVTLDWPAAANNRIRDAIIPVNDKILRANAGMLPVPPLSGLNPLVGITVHPLGGLPLGDATDTVGRVHGHPGLYVVDGSILPPAIGVNPSLTITALIERNIEAILRAGG